MEEIRKQVAIARRRLILEQFLHVMSWSMFGAFLVALIAVAVPKFWVLPVREQIWTAGWLGGAAAVGLMGAAVATWWLRKGWLEAALEVDRRFGLKERVSTALALDSRERDSEVGQALVEDAVRRVRQLELGEQFRVPLRRQNLWFLLPATAAFALALILPNRTPDAANAASQTSLAKDQVKKSTENLKKRVEQQRKQLEEKGLTEAEAMLEKLALGLDELKSHEEVDRKKALIKLNDLAQELENRRKELGSPDRMRDQLQQLKNLERGPADKMLNAIKEGDFGKATEQLQTLKDQLAKGEMSAEDREKMAKQLAAMKQKLNELAAAHEEAKQDLERQIEQKKASGDLAAAGKLQRQLDQLSQRDGQMNRMQELASKLGKASDAAKEGSDQQASARLDELASELKQMQADLQEMESIDSILDQLADAKDAMNCPECGGEGCENCQGKDGMSPSRGRMQRPGQGMGEGQGEGDRPEEETDTSFYDSKVRGKPQAGEAVTSGLASGPNKSGISRESVREQVISAMTSESDPLTEQRLPRTQREHAKQYFEMLRKGE